MKNMMMMAFALLFAMGAMAQKGKGKGMNFEKKAQKTADWMKEQLTLNDEQRNKIYNIHLDGLKKISAIRKDTTIGKDIAKNQIKSIKKSSMEQVKGVLTPAQFELLKTKLKERKEKHKQEHPKGEPKKNKAPSGGVEKEIEDELLGD